MITSVDRDDLKDSGARHFARCISTVRDQCEDITIEVLVPDFRGRADIAIDILAETPPDVFNHNLETVPLGNPNRLAALVEANDDFAAAFLEV